MRTLLLFAAAIGALAGAGCLRKTEFKCSESTQCGAGGACESTGFCSFADPDCASGRRYADYAGTTYSNQCVGGNGDTDGGVDGPDDGAMDDSLMGCPTSYSTTIGGHRYRVITTMANWTIQHDACAADGANVYLATPDDQTELDAIIAAASVARIWVGISDTAQEGTYATTAGGTIPDTDPMWASGEPDDDPVVGGGGPPGNCVSAATGELADDLCTVTYPAVCECVP